RADAKPCWESCAPDEPIRSYPALRRRRGHPGSRESGRERRSVHAMVDRSAPSRYYPIIQNVVAESAIVSFLLECPNCGLRDVNEFRFQGELTRRPGANATLRELTEYIYFRENVAGIQREWWYHRLGCGLWFIAERDTRSNTVLKVEIPTPQSAP